MQIKQLLPKEWSELSTDRFIEFKQLNPEEFTSVIEYRIAQLCVLLDTDTTEFDFDELYDTELEEIMDGIRFIKREPRGNLRKSINGLMFKPVETMTIGEFIDVSTLMQDFYQNFTQILCYAYRGTDENAWGKVIYQPIDTIPFDDRRRMFDKLSIDQTYPAVNAWVDRVQWFITEYTGLFDTDPEPVAEEDLKEMDAEEKKVAQQQNKFQKWAWEKTIHDLCDGDLTKFDEVTDMPATFVFNMMSMRSDLGISGGKSHPQF
jgi:hypothetical protein